MFYIKHNNYNAFIKIQFKLYEVHILFILQVLQLPAKSGLQHHMMLSYNAADNVKKLM